jgi:hypothetical protein
MANTYWMVPNNHSSAPASVRYPPLVRRQNFSCRSQCPVGKFIVNSGYQTRYPHVASATNLHGELLPRGF